MKRTLLCAFVLIMAIMPFVSSAQEKTGLTYPFKKGTPIKLLETWPYSQEEQDWHGRKDHRAIDFEAPQGTPIIAPIDGEAIWSYHLYYAENLKNGELVGYGLGQFCQLYSPQLNRFFILAHMSNVPEGIKESQHWLKSTQVGEYKAGELVWNPIELRQDWSKLQPRAKKVKRGEVIGYIGASGCSKGPFLESPTNIPTSPNQIWDQFHLHFEDLWRDEGGVKRDLQDPFDLYGPLEKYLSLLQGAKGKWLVGKDGRPLYFEDLKK